MGVKTDGQARCPRCGQGMRPGTTKTVVWVEERLFLVEDIPAQICDSCMDQYYDDETTEALRRLTEDRFPAAEMTREVTVPAFSLAKRLPKREAIPEEPSELVPAGA